MPNTTKGYATSGYVYGNVAVGVEKREKCSQPPFMIELGTKNDGRYDLVFYSEEECIFSFYEIYSGIKREDKFVLTPNGMYNIETVACIRIISYENNVRALLSPIHILERAKELGYVKS